MRVRKYTIKKNIFSERPVLTNSSLLLFFHSTFHWLFYFTMWRGRFFWEDGSPGPPSNSLLVIMYLHKLAKGEILQNPFLIFVQKLNKILFPTHSYRNPKPTGWRTPHHHRPWGSPWLVPYPLTRPNNQQQIKGEQKEPRFSFPPHSSKQCLVNLI